MSCYIVVDPSMTEAEGYARYALKPVAGTCAVRWEQLVETGGVTVRVPPSVLASDEKIIAVMQHESRELSDLQKTLEANGKLPPERIRSLINEASPTNLHGQAWAIADKRVAIFRARDPGSRAGLEKDLRELIEHYQYRNGW